MFRWLVNIGLLGLPVAVTLGILAGLQSQSDAPIFNSPTSGGGRKGDNSLKQFVECNRTTGIHPPTDGQGYTFNPNPWGWKDGEPGSLCVDVLGFNNGTYATKTTAPEFWVTWQYPPAAGDLPVHAFANIMIEDTKVLPVSLGSITQFNVDLEWTYTVGNSSWNATEATREQDLEDNLTNTNVAIDMFLSSDQKSSTTPTASAYEVMVWFGVYGPATQPLGADVIIGTQTVEGVKFDLHFDHNENKQGVLTWVAASNTEKFKGDLFPLLSFILDMKNSSFPNSADYLGYVSLGTEALSATKEVTFHVPTLSIDIGTSTK